MKLTHVCAALAVLAGLGATGAASAQAVADPRAGIVAGPQTSPELAAAIQARDALLFEIMFDRCDADALAPLLAEEFEFIHDKYGRIAASPTEFIASMRTNCEAQASGQNVRARRELVPGSLVIYAIQQDAAIAIGEHRFYGLAPGQAPHLRETGRFFIHWRLVDGAWRMSRAYSYDHRPAE